MRLLHSAFRLLALTAAVVLSPGVASAQNPDHPLTEKELLFRIREVRYTGADSAVVVLEIGTAGGIEAGMVGSAVGVRHDTLPPRTGRNLGPAWVVASDSNSATAVIRMKEPGQAAYRVLPGDLVELTLVERYSPTPGVLTDLVTQRISFGGDDGTELYQMWNVLFRDGDSLTSAVLRRMVVDLRKVAKRLSSDTSAALNTPIVSGRHAGKTLLQLVGKATEADLRGFFDYMVSYPGGYKGRHLNLAVTFADWANRGALPGKDAVRDELLAASDDAERRRLIMAQPDALSDGVWLGDWNRTANDWAGGGREADARRLNRVVLLVVDAYRLESRRGWALFGLAQIEHRLGNREAAIAAYRQAIPAFERVEDEEGVRYALNNIADELNRLNRFVDAVAVWDTVVMLERARTRVDSSTAQLESFAISVRGYAKALAKVDRYHDALRAYEEALALLRRIEMPRTQSQRASILTGMAGLFGNQGQRERAILTYYEARKLYRQLGHKEDEADQLDEIGYQTSELGQHRDAIAIWEEAYTLHMAAGERGDAGYSKSQIGQSLWTLGDYRGAIAAHEEAVRLREQAGDRDGVAYSLGKLASLYRDAGDPNTALQAYVRVARVYEELQNDVERAKVANNIGDVYYNNADYQRALVNYEAARVIQTRLATPRELALTLYDMGTAHRQLKAPDSAAVYFEQAAALQRTVGDEWNLITTLNALAGITESGPRRDRTRAEAYYREALALAAKLDARSLLAECYAALGRSAFARGKLDSALAYHRQSLATYRTQEDRGNEAWQLSAIGDILTQRGDLAGALQTYREGFTVAEQGNRRTEMGSLLTSMSWALTLQGNYQEAIRQLERALAINVDVNNAWGIAHSSTGLGAAYQSLGDYLRALEFHQRAESIYVALQSPEAQATPLNNIGTIYFWQGDYPRSLVQFHRALEIVTAGGAEGEFYPLLLSNIGEALYEDGRFDSAETWLSRALPAARAVETARIEGSTLKILGKIAFARGQLAAAGQWWAQADTVVRRSGERDKQAAITAELGKLAYARGDRASARTLLERAATQARELGATRYLWEPLYLLGLVYRDEGDTAKAVATLTEATAVVERLRSRIAGGEGAQKTFASGRVQGRLYEALVSLLVRQGRAEEALTVLDRSMNEELRSKYRGLGIQFADSTKARLLAEENQRKAELDGVSAQLTSALAKPDSLRNEAQIRELYRAKEIAEQEYLEFVNRLVREHPDLKNHTSVNLRDLRTSRRELPPDAAVLAFLPGERELYIFAVTSDTMVARVVELSREELDRKVDLVVRLARSPSATIATVQRIGAAGQAQAAAPPGGDLRREAADLYRALIAPVAGAIGGRKRLAIIPAGSLHYLPFQILPESADSAARTLGERQSVFYVTELKVPAASTTRRPVVRLAAFGNADSSLQNAEEEVLSLKRLYPTTQVFLRAAATEDKAKTLPPGFTVVHFATHGNLDYTNFENSYLTLAPSAPGPAAEDGRLTLREVWRLTGFDRRRLVVLSACNTAVADDQVGGWPNSPATAFLDAGVPTVIASLWPVDDAATAKLITTFYQNLKTMDTAEALRQAQMALRKDPKHAHPYFWGAWVLLGDWR